MRCSGPAISLWAVHEYVRLNCHIGFSQATALGPGRRGGDPRNGTRADPRAGVTSIRLSPSYGGGRWGCESRWWCRDQAFVVRRLLRQPSEVAKTDPQRRVRLVDAWPSVPAADPLERWDSAQDRPCAPESVTVGVTKTKVRANSAGRRTWEADPCSAPGNRNVTRANHQARLIPARFRMATDPSFGWGFSLPRVSFSDGRAR